MIPIKKISGMTTVLSIMGLVAGCAGTPDADSAANMADDPDRMVCKREKETGSRLSSRVCKTAGEWEQERHNNKEAIRSATGGGLPPADRPSAGGG